MASTPVLPYGRHVVDEADIAAVVEVLRGDWLTTGPAVEALEQAIAKETGAAQVAVVANGTAALHLAMLALPGPRGVAIVPDVTFVATANAARHAGFEVVLADVDADTGLMTPETFGAALRRAGTKPVRAVLPVDLAGQTVDKAGIQAIAAQHDIEIVDDSAHAFGSSYSVGAESVAVGSCRHARMACFSFHAVKNLTMGEGGAVCTNDTALAAHIRRLRHHGIVRDADAFVSAADARDASGEANAWYYEATEAGFNYRATDVQCALGLSQLRKIVAFRARRAALVSRYDERLKELSPRVRTLGRMPGNTPCWHLCVALIDFASSSRAKVMRRMRERGFGTQVHYIPLHRHPLYRKAGAAADFRGAERYYERALSLPLFASMTETDVDSVVDALAEALAA